MAESRKTSVEVEKAPEWERLNECVTDNVKKTEKALEATQALYYE